MKIDYEWLFKVSCAEVVTEVKNLIEGLNESSVADIKITLDQTFPTTAGRDQKIAVALGGGSGIIFEVRYWRGGSVDVKPYFVASAEVDFFSKY